MLGWGAILPKVQNPSAFAEPRRPLRLPVKEMRCSITKQDSVTDQVHRFACVQHPVAEAVSEETFHRKDTALGPVTVVSSHDSRLTEARAFQRTAVADRFSTGTNGFVIRFAGNCAAKAIQWESSDLVSWTASKTNQPFLNVWNTTNSSQLNRADLSVPVAGLEVTGPDQVWCADITSVGRTRN